MPTTKPPSAAPHGLSIPPSSAPVKPYSTNTAHHVVGVDDRRRHHAGHRPDRTGQSPAERQHPSDADADQTTGHRVLCRRPHRQPQRREEEEKKDEFQHPDLWTALVTEFAVECCAFESN